jgi:glutamine synthetase
MERLIYFIPKENHGEEDLRKILTSHTEIKFVSLVGIDLSGNDTDEKIPVSLFLEDISAFLKGAVQTDGSSVALPGIASLNNAKVDMLADTESTWFVNYNYEHIDKETNRFIGTLRIPCFLYHDNIAVDSRSILKKSISYFKTTLFNLFEKCPEALKPYGVQLQDIEDVVSTSATELEFWVKTPNNIAHIEELTTSQVLQEQYWKNTQGSVRTALEESLLIMEDYGLQPEMGHKEVGGIKSKLDTSGNLTHIMEQLEIDWKYSDALQAADNELVVKNIVRETFRRNGLDVTFLAKPIDGVAGSGEHTHVGMALKLKSGKIINLFTALKKHYLSPMGYASVMGILRNYEVINPFVSRSNDALRRLQPGFEAPICIVTSLGHSVDTPSRNRTVLLGLIRDFSNPHATRFEFRAPNPHSNTYLVLATLYQAMLQGIEYAIQNNKSEDELLQELSKNPDEVADYLEKGRAYRSEEDIFEDYTVAERESFFGKAPATVYENFSAFEKYPEKLEVLKAGEVFSDAIINSYKIASIRKWIIEINKRIIPNYSDEIRSYKMLHSFNKALDLDVSNWMKISNLRLYIMKTSYGKKSLFSRINTETIAGNYSEVSKLQLELEDKMKELRELYLDYMKNLVDI